MAINMRVNRYSRKVMGMVTHQCTTNKFTKTLEKLKSYEEKVFLETHVPVFPFEDIWDEFLAFEGEFIFLAKLVRVASAADGWSHEVCEHFGKLAMSVAARAKVLQGSCDAHSMYVEHCRELDLIRAFYGSDCSEDDWPHCTLIAIEYAIGELLNLESGVLYGHHIDL